MLYNFYLRQFYMKPIIKKLLGERLPPLNCMMICMNNTIETNQSYQKFKQILTARHIISQ